MISVVVLADVRLYRDGLALTLQGYDDISVVRTWHCGAGILAQMKSVDADVIVLDVSGRASLETLRTLRRVMPGTKVIAFAVDELEPDLITYAEAGAVGYVTADASVEELVEMIRSVVRGELVCPPRIASTLLHTLACRGTERTLAEEDPLTNREWQVLELICQGLSNKEIAHAFNIAEATVKNHVHHLLDKLNVSKRSQAAARARDVLELRRSAALAVR